jgi:speckle-type POZ protein
VQLKNACLGFIASPEVLGAVIETDGYKHLVASCRLVEQEILAKIAAFAKE